MIDLAIYTLLQNSIGTMPLDIKFTIKKGEFVTLYGPSGSGKTSTLKIIAGLLKPERGTIKVDNALWLDTHAKINLKPQHRQVGIVFQDYGLFPNMSVRKNIEYALKKGQNKDYVEELIDIMELGELQHQKPNLLSGGQKQRTALARTLVQKPKILLLDEPLSSLDINLRSKLQEYLLQIHKKHELTTILVTHNKDEILKLSDRVLVLENGKIVPKSASGGVFEHQNSETKLQFAGEVTNLSRTKKQYTAIVNFGNKNIKEIKIPTTEIKNLKIGDHVLITTRFLNSKVQKITKNTD